LQCLKKQIDSGWTGRRITKEFLSCAMCRQDITGVNPCVWATLDDNEKLLFNDILSKIEQKKNIIRKAMNKCFQRATQEDVIPGLDQMKHGKQQEIVYRTMAAYMCTRCSEPFCGGLVECEAAGQHSEMKTIHCPRCAWHLNTGGNKCKKGHGPEFAVYKCDCCCSYATYDCSGNHYCQKCHNHWDKKCERPYCQGLPDDKCPLGVPHPPNRIRNHPVEMDGCIIGCSKCMGMEQHVRNIVSRETRARWQAGRE